MRVLWVGDAVVSSGFARCSHAACDALHAAGHEVHVLGLNYFGDPHPYPYPVYPCRQPLDGGHDGFGVTRLPRLVARLRPDVVVLLNDPWNVPAYLDHLDQLPEDVPRPPVAGWLAVDGRNQHASPLNRLAHVAVWTQFAADELRRGGYQGASTIIPLGVDHRVFRPLDRATARRRAMPPALPESAYIVGVVGRNQPRKRLDLTLDYFAAWLREHSPDNAYLYLHVAPTGDAGADIRSLVRYHCLKGRVILHEPHIGHGVTSADLAATYSALDVYLTTTQGEGWGLPALEAMACGVPVIAPDWSALGDWAAGAARLVPCDSTALTAPMNSLAYTIGGIPSRTGTVRALQDLYASPDLRADHASRGLALAAGLTWHDTGRMVCEMLEQVIEPPLPAPCVAESGNMVAESHNTETAACA